MTSLFYRLRYGKKFTLRSVSNTKHGRCHACGYISEYKKINIINNQLMKTWDLNSNQKDWFDKRESMHCSRCGSSLRSRQLARCIVDIFGKNTECLSEFVETSAASQLKVAEINTAGSLHPMLSKIKHLKYSEYKANSKNIQSEDIQNLSYKNNSFDLVITSDTLEHIPDLDKALSEIRRITKIGGYHIFTIPLLIDRATKKRAVTSGDKIINIHPESYHGLDNNVDYMVFYEFGIDIIKQIDSYGNKSKLYYMNLFSNEPYFVIVSKRIG